MSILPENRNRLPPLSTSTQLDMEAKSNLTPTFSAESFSLELLKHYPRQIVQGLAWLDLGCGIGNVSAGVAIGLKNKGASLPTAVTLVDTYNHAQRSQERLNQLGVPTTFIRRDMFQLDLPCSSFGFIFCFNVSEYFEATNDTGGIRGRILLAQAANWLASGGCLIFYPLFNYSPIISMAGEYGFNCFDRAGTYFFEKKME